MPREQAQRMARPAQPNGPGIACLDWDATKVKAPPELLQAGFQLAHFIIPNRPIAIDILVRALEKVKVRSRREITRLYWRDKHAERPVRRIARSDVDMLQWLIMFESEQEERAQERTGNASLKGMAIRYIKHLVQITTGLSSFYVNVGLTRLLHNYSTSEAQRAYEMLTNRYLGADEYRRAKAALMHKMSQRFAGFLTTTRFNHGELRFEAFDDQKQWVGLVDVCLKAFTPWSTQGLSLQFVAAAGDNTKLAMAKQINRNDIELKCCHIFIEPQCFRQLVKELALEPPATKLALPRFVMTEKEETNDDGDVPLGPSPVLSEEELGKIERRLAATDARRRNLDPRFIIVVIDDTERGRFDLTETKQWQIDVEAGANLLEIRAEDERGELVLATHLISYVSHAFDISTATATLNRGKLRLRVNPIDASGQDPARAVLSLNYHPKFSLTRLWSAWRKLTNYGAKVRSLAVTGLTTALIVCGAVGAFHAHRVKLLEQQLQQAQRRRQQLSPTAAGAIVSYALSRDEGRVRGPGSAAIPEISLPLHTSAVTLELPLSERVEGSYSAALKTFGDNRTLTTQNFLRPTRRDTGWAVEIVIAVDLLKRDTYYTVHLRGPDATDHYTFRVVTDH